MYLLHLTPELSPVMHLPCLGNDRSSCKALLVSSSSSSKRKKEKKARFQEPLK